MCDCTPKKIQYLQQNFEACIYFFFESKTGDNRQQNLNALDQVLVELAGVAKTLGEDSTSFSAFKYYVDALFHAPDTFQKSENRREFGKAAKDVIIAINELAAASRTRNKIEQDYSGGIERLSAVPANEKLSDEDYHFLCAFLHQPGNRPSLSQLARKEADPLAKLRLLRDYNRNLRKPQTLKEGLKDLKERVETSPRSLFGQALKDDIDFQRKFMMMAVEEARKCKPKDERINPRVGAVVVKDGTVLATAYRSELAEGDHAEYTALEKRLHDKTIAGATVYTTLEPCTARGPSKMPCADRLIQRRVKRVVIGMPDPNRTVYGEGWAKLREAGIDIANFDDDLKAEIEEMNREFIRHHKNPTKGSSGVSMLPHTGDANSSPPTAQPKEHSMINLASLRPECYELLKFISASGILVEIQDIPGQLADAALTVCMDNGHVECFNPLIEDAKERGRRTGCFPTKIDWTAKPTHIRLTKKGQACLAEYRLHHKST